MIILQYNTIKVRINLVHRNEFVKMFSSCVSQEKNPAEPAVADFHTPRAVNYSGKAHLVVDENYLIL